MLSLTIRSIFRGWQRPALLALGLLAVTAGVLLVAAASQTTVIAADQELRRYWRGFYDILVRPAGSRSPIEEKHGLVEANHLSGIWGGITFQQYEAIKSIPGIEVAAPIAMIGYVDGWAPGEPIGLPPEQGVYVLEQTVTVNDGARSFTPAGFPRSSYMYYDPKQPFDPLLDNEIRREMGISLRDRYDASAYGGVLFPFLMAGIDPPAEAALVGLDRSVVQGRYLRADELLEPRFARSSDINLPILINSATYVDLLHRADLKRVLLPPNESTLDDVRAKGGISYLESLPRDPVGSTEMDGQEIYGRMLDLLTNEKMILGMSAAQSVPSALVYREIQGAFDSSDLMLVLELHPDQDGDGVPEFRDTLPLEEKGFNVGYLWNVVGTFDIENLPSPADPNRVPFETYFPPISILRYDEQGSAVYPPLDLHPTLDPESYLQAPPLVITTLEAARAVSGEAAISAIRVRIGGIEDLSSASQRKIEAVAIEIARSTGLTVDIVVGSSPTRVLVQIPGIGYVEEQWIKKGVNLTYREGIQTGSWLLIGTVLVAGALFTLDLTWAEVTAERRWIALQKALGWRSRTVLERLLGRTLLVSSISIGTGTALAWTVTRVLHWKAPETWLLLGLPLAVLTLAVLASLPPAWIVSRAPPVIGIQHPGLRRLRGRIMPARTLASYAWSSLVRRPARTLLTVIGSALSAALLVLLLAVTIDQRGMLSGTLLGEFILVRVDRFHYAIVGIGFGLAALATANGLLGGIIERRREIGVLKAIGWRTTFVARLFVLEGILLGLAGGVVGALLGGGAFSYLYRTLSPTLALVALVGAGVAGLVGGLAALYPAFVAARVPPAEAVRYD